jgi:hypothetical protein
MKHRQKSMPHDTHHLAQQSLLLFYFCTVLNDYSDALEPGVSTLADFWAHEAEGVLWDGFPADDEASALEVLPP